jgi:hypothetical protein
MESKRPAYLFFSLLVFLLAICVVLVQQSSAGGRLRPSPTAVAIAPTELVNRLRADAFTYFGSSIDRGRRAYAMPSMTSPICRSYDSMATRTWINTGSPTTHGASPTSTTPLGALNSSTSFDSWAQ